MKNIKYIIFIAVFFLLSLVPFLCMTFYETDETSEGRVLAEFPKLFEEGKFNTDFLSDFEDYFGDHFAFRSELVDADAIIKLKLFKTSSEEKVITGKDSWLFYAETLSDYSGTENLSEGEISRIGRIIALESAYCRKYGKGYVFTIAPNKNSVYPEMMADYYLKTQENSNLENLNEDLFEKGVTVCDLKSILIAAKKDGNQLYYKYDSHWNLLGATYGYRAILDSINEECGFVYVDFDSNVGTIEDGEREGDLLKMVTPLHSISFEKFATETNNAKYKVQGIMKSVDDLRIITKCENLLDSTKLLMYRDSFGRALIEPLSDTFCEVTYLRANPFDIYDYLDANTVVVREIVERNIDTLLEYAPVVPISEFTGDIEILVKIDGEPVTMKTEERGELTHYYGTFNSSDVPDDYVALVKTGDGKIYEAFPIVENSLDEKDVLGYSFYAPNTINMDNFEVVFYNG